jgi:hypothetical protein
MRSWRDGSDNAAMLTRTGVDGGGETDELNNHLTAFSPNGAIPALYTCEEDPPPLPRSGVPAGSGALH